MFVFSECETCERDTKDASPCGSEHDPFVMPLDRLVDEYCGARKRKRCPDWILRKGRCLMDESKQKARDESSEVVVNKVDGSEWDKLVDALYVVAASLERVRAAHSTDKTSLEIYVHDENHRRRGPDGILGGTLTMVDPSSHDSGYQYSLEKLAEVIIRECVPDKPAFIVRKR